MSPLNPVPPLYNVCLSYLWKIIQDLHKKEFPNRPKGIIFDGQLSPKLKKLREVLIEQISPHNCENLLAYADQEFSKDSVFNLLKLPMLLTKQTKSITLPEFYREDEQLHPQSTPALILLLSIRKIRPSNIVYLNMRNNTLDDVQLFENMLINLPLLESLEFGNWGNCEDIFRIIGKHCENLKFLNARNCVLTSNGMKKLCFTNFPFNSLRNPITSTLQTFFFCTTLPIPIKQHVGNNGVLLTRTCQPLIQHRIPPLEPEDVFFMLQNFPKLRDVNYNRLAEVLILTIQRKKVLPFFQSFRLIQSDMTEFMFNSIARYCQDVKHVSLIYPHQNVLTKLHFLPNVKTLFSEGPYIQEYIEIHGHKLEILYCGDVPYLFEVTDTDLSNIGQKCPNLRELYVSNLCVVSNKNLDYSFNNLEALYLKKCRNHGFLLIKLLSKLPRIKRLIIELPYYFCDWYLKQILKVNEFVNLEILYFDMYSEITLKGIDALIEKCPKLTELGNLIYINNSAGHRLQFDEFNEYKYEVNKKRNIKISLHYCESYFDLSSPSRIQWPWRQSSVLPKRSVSPEI